MQTVCVANISPKGRRMRFILGCLTLAATIYQVTQVCAAGVPHSFRLTIFLPAFVSVMGFMQAREHT